MCLNLARRYRYPPSGELAWKGAARRFCFLSQSNSRSFESRDFIALRPRGTQSLHELTSRAHVMKSRGEAVRMIAQCAPCVIRERHHVPFDGGHPVVRFHRQRLRQGFDRARRHGQQLQSRRPFH